MAVDKYSEISSYYFHIYSDSVSINNLFSYIIIVDIRTEKIYIILEYGNICINGIHESTI